MGQYYKPTFLTPTGDIFSLYSRDFHNGAKLMEHSYIGNSFVNAALVLLMNTPTSIAWMGDYSDNPYDGPYASKVSRAEFKRIYSIVWADSDVSDVPPSFFKRCRLHDLCPMSTRKKYLVNHTTRESLHMGDYIAENKYAEMGGWKNGVYDASLISHWCVHPLPLLTACGNDRGGGDFHQGGVGYEQVGIWAFDTLEYAGTVPAGYQPVMFTFLEAGSLDKVANA